MRTILKTVAAVAAIPLGMGVLGACSASGPIGDTHGGRIQVVVAENTWGSIVGQLAGPDADVSSIITNPATDPHAYEPTARDAREIASAQYVVVNGIGYDAWAQKLVDANPSGGRTVLDVGKLLGLDDGANPHQWYAPRAVRRFVTRVASDLAKLDPEHRSGYDARRNAFESSGLREFNVVVAKIRAQFSGAPIGASESVVVPLAGALGLRVITPESFLHAVAEGNDPTESDKAKVDAQIADHEISVFVYNSQNATPDVQRLVDAARRERIPVTTMTETLVPAGATFQAWQVAQLRAVLSALTAAART